MFGKFQSCLNTFKTSVCKVMSTDSINEYETQTRSEDEYQNRLQSKEISVKRKFY